MLTVLGIAMVALGAIFAAFSWRRYRAKVAECELASRTWQSVDGTLHEAAIGERTDRDSDGDRTVTHVPQARFGYHVGGRQYEGTRAYLARDAFSNKREADAWLAARPAGSTTKVWYDPANPESSTLEIDRPAAITYAVFGVVGLVFAGVGAIFLFF